MEAKTYTKRENARRAGVAAGVPVELVEITVHKDGDEVRFGWKAMEPGEQGVTTGADSQQVEPKQAKPRVQLEERNGIKRPKEGGLCAKAWSIFDGYEELQNKHLAAISESSGINPATVRTQYARWRQFNGLTGRQPKP